MTSHPAAPEKTHTQPGVCHYSTARRGVTSRAFACIASVALAAWQGPPAKIRPVPYQFRANAFIAAFNFPADDGFDILWPHRAMPPAPYKAVALLIDRMPDARKPANPAQDWEPMPPASFLRVNGNVPRPLQAKLVLGDAEVRGAAFFAPLEGGRFRLTLAIPEGWRVHPAHNRVEVRLYQIDGY